MEEKNTLYWIRGNKENPEGVRKALEENGITPFHNGAYENESCVFFGCPAILPNDVIELASSDNAELFMNYGVELQPVEETQEGGNE